MNIWSKIRRRFIAIFASPITAAALAIAAPLAGFWVAIHNSSISSAIKSRFPPANFDFFGLNGDAWIFIALLSVLGIGFAFHKSAEAARTRERHEALDREIQVVATLGLERAADEFRLAIEESYPVAILNVFTPNPREEDLVKAIRIVLGKILAFVQALDVAPSSTCYSCSLFLFHSQDELTTDTAERDRLLERRAFKEEMDFDPGTLYGLLELAPQFFTSTAKTSTTPEVVVLPIPQQILSSSTTPSGQQRYKVLPGAAYSAATGKHGIIRNRNDLVEWCKNADYQDQLRDAVLRYFTTGIGATVKSFLTLPIFAPATKSAPLLGVLSIERSTDDLLPGKREDVFVPIWSPLQYFLAELLAAYLKIHRPAPPLGQVSGGQSVASGTSIGGRAAAGGAAPGGNG